jgi:hypothetical protein
MDQIKVRLFSTDGGDFSPQFLNWNFGLYEYKNIKIVIDDSYTHAVLFGIPRIDLKIPKENVIGIQCEPFEIYDLFGYQDYIESHISTYYCSVRNLDSKKFKEGITYLAPYPLKEIEKNYKKTKLISMVASDKGFLPGHRLRHGVIRELLNSDLNIDIYGRNIQYMYNDPRVKGTIENKKDAMIPYQYTISIENVYDFISEKLYDPIIFDCIPFYWGDMNKVSSYKNSVISLPHNPKEIVNLIKQIIQYNNSNEIINEVKRFKNDILNHQFNLAEFIWKNFNKES